MIILYKMFVSVKLFKTRYVRNYKYAGTHTNLYTTKMVTITTVVKGNKETAV